MYWVSQDTKYCRIDRVTWVGMWDFSRYTGYPRILSIAGLKEPPEWGCPEIYWISQDTKYCRIDRATWGYLSTSECFRRSSTLCVITGLISQSGGEVNPFLRLVSAYHLKVLFHLSSSFPHATLYLFAISLMPVFNFML